MNKKTLSLSVVIPTYNEEEHIGKCLDAIAAQIVMPDEVIVVDNNSSDNTVAIAKSYDFVTLISEPQQGVLFARNRGFNAATCDIIGRIDADTQISKEWCDRIRELFKEEKVDVVTGSGVLALAPFLPMLRNRFWVSAYHQGARAYFGFYTLWGSNMALRRKAWDKVKKYANKAEVSDTHEDQALSVQLNLLGSDVYYLPKLQVNVASERFWVASKLLMYYRRSLSTIAYAKQLRQHLDKKAHSNVSNIKRVFLLLITTPFTILFFLLSLTSKLYGGPKHR